MLSPKPSTKTPKKKKAAAEVNKKVVLAESSLQEMEKFRERFNICGLIFSGNGSLYENYLCIENIQGHVNAEGLRNEGKQKRLVQTMPFKQSLLAKA